MSARRTRFLRCIAIFLAVSVVGLWFRTTRTPPAATQPSFDLAGKAANSSADVWSDLWQIYERGLLMLTTGTPRESVGAFWDEQLRRYSDGPVAGEATELRRQLLERLHDPDSQAWIRVEDTSRFDPTFRIDHHWKWVPYGTGLVMSDSRMIHGRRYPWQLLESVVQHLDDDRLVAHTPGLRVKNYALWSLCLSTGIPFGEEPAYDVTDSIRDRARSWWTDHGQFGPIAGYIASLQTDRYVDASLEDQFRILQQIEHYSASNGSDRCASVFDCIDHLKQLAARRLLLDRLAITRELERRGDKALRAAVCRDILAALPEPPGAFRESYPFGIGYLVTHGSSPDLQRLCDYLQDTLNGDDQRAIEWVKYTVKFDAFRRPEMVALMVELMRRFPHDRVLCDICYRWSVTHTGSASNFELVDRPTEADSTDSTDSTNDWADEDADEDAYDELVTPAQMEAFIQSIERPSPDRRRLP